jgi:hypothetical protein
MQTTHFPLVPSLVLTNHTPPNSSPYQLLSVWVNVRPQPYTFTNALDHPHVRPFPPSTLLAPPITHDQTPNQPHFLNTFVSFASFVGANLPIQG